MIRYKKLNDTNDKIPEIGIGTWKMGQEPRSEAEAIKTAIRHGIKFIDTAEMYGSEWVVKDAIGSRKDLFIATKVSPSHFKYESLIESCEASLRNLGIKSIDLYQLHWPNHRVPIKETMRAMEDLVDLGRIRHIGVSNFTVEELVEAQNAMERYEIVSNQVEYSVLTRDIENELLDFCTKNRITIIAYSPLGTGALYGNKYKNVLGTLEGIGKRHGKTATQVALNWLISKKNVVAIPKSGSSEHVIEIAGASGWSLSKSEKSEIDSIKERKSALGGFMYPILKNTSWWASAMQSFNEKRSKVRQKKSTTKSSKK